MENSEEVKRLGADSQTERTKRYLEKHFDPYNVVANAGHDPLPEAGATEERTL